MNNRSAKDRVRDRYSLQQVMDMMGVAVDWNASLNITSYVWTNRLSLEDLEYSLENEPEEGDDDDWYM